jgi:prepilin-type N-terminal cleavage/methylation domain-containing protein/prepilin-type processing-associated H-X9-DG protein
MSYTRIPARRAFTLVELLVVIGIIALLISILLPSLAAAREQGNTVKCLSNLRQLAQAAAMYTSQHKGFHVPGDLTDLSYPVSLPYQDYAETWATILVADGFIKYPEVTSTTSPPMEDNILRCPSGVFEMSAVTFNNKTIPSSRLDSRGAMGVLHTSTRLRPNTHLFSWYGINACSDTNVRTPYSRMYIKTSGQIDRGIRKANEVRNPTEMVFLFDGLLGVNYLTNNANRINARHNKKKITNFAFCDGHAESLETKSLPGGSSDQSSPVSDFTVANLAKFPFPKWRLDQR